MIELRRDWSEIIITMQKDMERLMDEVANRKPPSVHFAPKAWQPAIDVFETDSEVVILLELAGVNENEIEVTVQHDILTIRGTRMASWKLSCLSGMRKNHVVWIYEQAREE